MKFEMNSQNVRYEGFGRDRGQEAKGHSGLAERRRCSF